MVSSLENWDGSLSTSKQNGSRITDLEESAGASTTLHKTITVPDERSNTLGNGHGFHDTMTSLDVNHMVCCLFDGLCIAAQVAVYLERRVKFD
jgi:hypothetical protein